MGKVPIKLINQLPIEHQKLKSLSWIELKNIENGESSNQIKMDARKIRINDLTMGNYTYFIK